MIPDSSAGTDREPDRYRWVTFPLPSGCGELTVVSVVPNAADSAAIVPLTVRRRDASRDSVTVSPYRPSTSPTSAASDGSAPYRSPSSVVVIVWGR